MTYNIVFPFAGTPVNIADTDAGKPCSTDGKTIYERIDAGVDLMAKDGAGVGIYSAAAGTIDIKIDPGGFGTYPVLYLDDPITLDNNVGVATAIYYGHVQSVLTPDANGLYVSTKVKANELIAKTSSPPGGNATQLGWLEIGFWNDLNGGPIQHPTSQEAATNSGREMFKALFGDISSVASGGPLGAASPGGSGSGDNSGAAKSDDTQKQIDAAKKYATTPQKQIDDPRDNRPFSPWFLGQVMGAWPGSAGTGTGSVPNAGNPHGEGGLRWINAMPPNFPLLPQGTKMPYVNLVRGGMTEIPPRVGGQLAVFFMMNPDSINFWVNIDSSKATTDSLNPNNQQAEYFTTAQSVNFTIWFNRMYEVWMGDMPAGGGPGPSSEGVRWDIRALERLVGLLDAVSDPSISKIGLSNNSPMSGSAGSLPVQLVFGGANSMQFQGRIQSLTYTYTRFDANMIPTEASVAVGVQRVYNPPASADMITSMVTNAPQVYSADYSYTNWNALIKEPAGSRSGLTDKNGNPLIPGIPNPNTVPQS